VTINLNNLIREVSTEFPESHPHKLARLVAERTDPDEMFECYVSALERLVADRIRCDRNMTLNSKKGRSPKIEERRNWWKRVMGERLYVGNATYKALGDCTIDNLLFCISERRDQIGALQGQINKYEAIVAAMQKAGATIVRELPEGAVEL